ncbi:hypothetical protein, partial [Escherichia coli]|uniref:hypothetical protein n=1 Tax=Escherichia coli TaxID=562 RepID=UPI003A854A3F
MSLNKPHVGKHKHTEYEARCQKNAFSGCHTWSLSSASAFATIILKWSTKTGHRVRVFSSIDFPIRLVVTHHYIRAV